jgi:hypothetical protein
MMKSGALKRWIGEDRAKAIWGEQPLGQAAERARPGGARRGAVTYLEEFIRTDARQKKLATAMGLNLVTF